jgi:hypothetical protein
MAAQQTVEIYQNRRSGVVRIQPFGRLKNGSSQPFGVQTVLQADVGNEQLVSAVLDNLAKNDTQKYELSSAPKYSDAEYRKILKEDRLISVQRLDEGYQLIQFRRMRGSFGSIDDSTKTVSSSEFQSTAAELIRQMFEEIP